MAPSWLTVQPLLPTEVIRDPSPSPRGCAQGSKSGPILWNIFFDPILSLPFPQGVIIQALAADIQLVITGHPDTLPSSAQTSLDLINTWCHKLKLSSSKSSILPIFCHNPSLDINFIPIPCLEEMTILGVKFDSRLSFSSHLNHICSKTSNLFPRLHTCANAYYGLGFKARRLMHTAVFEPTLTYAAAIWGEAENLGLLGAYFDQHRGNFASTPSAASARHQPLPPLH
ncbi:hypothetical protein LAZ67_20001233 [Cordylochernes scorpioides]|uniref:Reverse transcriptase n=1 Tax=Cordylochernes scorpioides TaxID=51811 RepID=A0ABY6LJS0_9ARAC|nr:hypothetical protein LAZ67_20001233 [Cordylochernes scorpioides]